MNKKLYAFWEYPGRYPPVIGSKIKSFKDDGRVEVDGFQGYSFKPIKILPLKTALEVQDKLDSLEHEYRSSKKIFEKEWKDKFKKVFCEEKK